MRFVTPAWIVALAWVLPAAVAFVPSNYRHTTRAATTTRSWASPEPLATEGDWVAFLDEETTGVIYYFNTKTGESAWEPPTTTFPEVYLRPSKRRKAEAKRAEYYKKLQKDEEGKKGFLSKLLEPKEEDALMDEPQGPGWMKRILEEKGFSLGEEDKPGLFARFMSPPATAEPRKVESNEIRVEPQKKEKTAPAVEERVSGLLKQILPLPTAEPKAKPAAEKKAKQPEPSVAKSSKPAKSSEPAKPLGGGFLDQLFTETAEAAARSKEQAEAAAAALAAKAAAVSEARAARAAAEKEARAAKVAEEARIKVGREAAVARRKAEKEEEARMRDLVLKAEAEQKAESDRLAAEARAAEAAEAAAAAAEQIYVEERATPIKVEMGTSILPHPSKVLWGGEDAIFTKGRTFGVFDGVSGADKTDGMPLYSKMLAREMDTLVGDGNDLSVQALQDQLLVAAEKADARATGASTAIVASISDNGFLRAINLGDSRCIVIRGGKIVAQTKEIIHYFDCPYQLSEISPDRPRDARKLNVELVRGDIVMMASDGIFDNLEDEDIVDIIASAKNVKAAAKQISDRSRKVSLNSQASTPYSRQAQKNGDPDFKDGLGGKVDDISCIVVQYV